MRLTVSTLKLHRPERGPDLPHWIGLGIACPHLDASTEVAIEYRDEAPEAAKRHVAAQAEHGLAHQLLRAIGRQGGCSCAQDLRVFCWPEVAGIVMAATSRAPSKN